jgi:hypothetical protein
LQRLSASLEDKSRKAGDCLAQDVELKVTKKEEKMERKEKMNMKNKGTSKAALTSSLILILMLVVGSGISLNHSRVAMLSDNGNDIKGMFETLSTPPTTEWNRTYGGAGYDYAYCAVQTSDGGYALAGFTNSFGAGMWLVKTDAAGNVLWNKTYSRSSGDVAHCLIQTSDGGYAIAGYTRVEGAGNDFWLVKTDASGNVQWNRTYGGTIDDTPYSVVQTSDGGYALAGITYSFGGGWLVKTDSAGNLLWNETYGGGQIHSMIQTIDGGYALAGWTNIADAWLIRTDNAGNSLWNKTYGGGGADAFYSVVRTHDEGYALAGMTYSLGAGSGDFWLVKTNSSGDVQWNNTYGGTAADNARSVVQTSDGGYALGGITKSFGAGQEDFWLVRTNSAGNVLWNTTYGGIGIDEARSVVQTSDGGYALAGSTTSFGAGSYDFWLIKIASDGEGGSLADYGDAPDDSYDLGNVFAYPGVVGKFPSLYNTHNSRLSNRRGSFHLTTTREWLGNESSVTTRETDARIVDNDIDDCDPMLYINATGVGFFVISVAGGPEIITEDYCYVNILFDQNRDGEWKNTLTHTEWVAANTVVIVPSNTQRRVVCGPFIVLNATLLGWVRITLTREWINPSNFINVGGWDGSGPADGFEYGETEDWYFDPHLYPERVRPFPCTTKEAAVVATANSERGGGDKGCHGSIPCDKSKTGWLWWWWQNRGCVAVNVTSINIIPKFCSVPVDVIARQVRKNLAVVPEPTPQNPITLQPFETLRIDIIVTWDCDPCEAKEWWELKKLICGGKWCPVCGEECAGHLDADLIIDPEGQDYYVPSSPVAIVLDNKFDIAVTNVTLDKNIVGQNYTVKINVTVTNLGDFNETSTVILYADKNITVIGDEYIIGNQSINMTNGAPTTIVFVWNTSGFEMGNCTISAYAKPVLGETNTTDNTFINGWIIVTIPGDVDGDFDVDILDVTKICIVYGLRKGEPEYVPNRDINRDGKIDILDVVIACIHYGEKYP